MNTMPRTAAGRRATGLRAVMGSPVNAVPFVGRPPPRRGSLLHPAGAHARFGPVTPRTRRRTPRPHRLCGERDRGGRGERVLGSGGRRAGETGEENNARDATG